MATQEEKLRILQMVAEGKIKPDEAATLLAALEQGGEGETPTAAATDPAGQGHWLRVRAENGAQKVNIRLPWRLLDIGLKIARRFAPEEVDIDKIHAALNEALANGLPGKMVEVHDDEGTQHVEIWIE